MDGPGTRHTLITKLRDPSDREAWREFVAIYEPLVYQLARQKGLQDADARDVCQDVFRAVARAIDRWEPAAERGTFRGWLFTIARNLVINFLSRRDRHPRGSGDSNMHALLNEIPAVDPGVTAQFETAYRRRLFHWAAEQVRDEFTAKTWQAFWQTAVENRPVAEVAAELSLSVGAVYISRSRVMARLRTSIEKLGEETATQIGGDNGYAI